MTKASLITVDEVNQRLEYFPENGDLKWRYCADMHKRWNARWAGKCAGTYSNGYVSVRINGTRVPAQRIIWALMTGNWPAHCIDHIDSNSKNNKWDNLREATVSQNGCNRGRQNNNRSGYKGVSWCNRYKKWQSHIQFRNKQKNLGYYATPEEAYAAYCKAAADLHGEFCRLA